MTKLDRHPPPPVATIFRSGWIARPLHRPLAHPGPVPKTVRTIPPSPNVVSSRPLADTGRV